MKLPAPVLAEALDDLCRWAYTGDDLNEGYHFPRQFDGGAVPAGHVLVLSPAAHTLPETGTLAVYTAPVNAGGPALIPDREVSPEAVLTRLTGLYDRLSAWEEALEECSLDLAGVQRMLEISADAMNGSLGLIDESYNMPAYTGVMARLLGANREELRRPDDESIADLADDPQITAVRSARGVHVYESPDESRSEPSLFINLFRPGESSYFNRLLYVRPGAAYTQTDRFMLARLAARLERLTRTLPTYSMPVSRYAALQRCILSAADGNDLPDAESTAVLSPLGWKREDAYRMLLFRSIYPQRDAGISEYILRQLEQLFPASCGAMEGARLFLLLNTARCPLTFREIRSRLAEFLRENMYKAGVSNEAASFDRLRGAYLQALSAMELGSLRDPMFWYYLFEDYLQDYLLRKASEDIPADMLTLPAVETLRRHDVERGTHFVETLRALCEENFNVSHAARRLYIHRTSFQDRMERIRALTGLDPEDEKVRFLLQFSFRLLKTRPEG